MRPAAPRSREPFAFASLWDLWRGLERRELATFTIIATQANELLKPLRRRACVGLEPKSDLISFIPSREVSRGKKRKGISLEKEIPLS